MRNKIRLAHVYQKSWVFFVSALSDTCHDSIRYQCPGVTKVPTCDRSLAYGERVQLLSLKKSTVQLSGNEP